MITILKRTRTEITPSTDPKTYNDWSVWAETNDVAPYTNTDLVEYKTSTTVDFKEEYLATYTALMSESIGTGTPYKETLDFLQSELDDDNLTPKEKANLKAQVMANITTSITNNAMQLAITVTDKQIKISDEVSMLEDKRYVSNSTVDHKVESSSYQRDNLKATAEYTVEKKTQLISSVKYNNMTKALDYFDGAYGQHKMGGGAITPSMWNVPMEIAKALAYSSTNLPVFGAVTTTE